MPMNLIIQEKRKELGLTQEQIAEYLNVSIPAVSKWESGVTNPDISLLPPLARLLKTDLNTLFCFQDDISQQEIGYFCQEVATIVKTKGIASGFEAARQKLHEYPHNETLLHCLTLQLDGHLCMSGLTDAVIRQYDSLLVQWYRRLAKSNDSKISNSANFMLVSRFIRSGDYDKAQEILDVMPDKEDYINSMADKRILQINLYLCQGKTEQAVKDLQNILLMTVNKVQLLLHKMVDAELADSKVETAKDIADKASKMTSLFDLWSYNAFVAPLQIAGAEKNADECIFLLQKLLTAALTPWNTDSSSLFYRIAQTSDAKQMLPAILSDLENNPAYDFLRSHDEFQKLLAKAAAASNSTG